MSRASKKKGSERDGRASPKDKKSHTWIKKSAENNKKSIEVQDEEVPQKEEQDSFGFITQITLTKTTSIEKFNSKNPKTEEVEKWLLFMRCLARCPFLVWIYLKLRKLNGLLKRVTSQLTMLAACLNRAK
jgi:hypothetical protein